MKSFVVLLLFFSASGFAEGKAKCEMALQSYIISSDMIDFWLGLEDLGQIAVYNKVEKFVSKNSLKTPQSRDRFRLMMESLLGGRIVADNDNQWVSRFLLELAKEPDTIPDLRDKFELLADLIEHPPQPK